MPNTQVLASAGKTSNEIILNDSNFATTSQTINLLSESKNKTIKLPDSINFEELNGIRNIKVQPDKKVEVDRTSGTNTKGTTDGFAKNTELQPEIKIDNLYPLSTTTSGAILISLSVNGIEAVIDNDTAVVNVVHGTPAGNYPVEFAIDGEYITIDGEEFISGDNHTFIDSDSDGTWDTATITVYGEREQVSTYYLNVVEAFNSPPVAFISMQYNGQSYSYQGIENINTDEQIYKDTQIVWTSNSFDPDGDDIIEVEWENAQEYYNVYGEQLVKLRVKDSNGLWSGWSEISFTITNRAPIPGLEYLILNPSSIINGNLTTDTQIAWLWSYGGEDFTYDPDGDAITQIAVTGISQQDVLGYLSGGIGFVTQFSVPGQYYMTYRCADSEGAWSEDNTFIINAEPTNGNTRPICVINYSTLETDITSPIVWTWMNSYDPDPNDTISNIEAKVIKDGQETPLSEYITLLVDNGCRTAFTEPGIYRVMFRVSDNRNAWSNWSVMDVTVTDPTPVVFENIEVISNVDDDFPFDYPPAGQYWFLEEEAINAMNAWIDSPEILYQLYQRDSQPESGKVISSDGFTVKGVAKTQSGEALQNRYVNISYTYKNNSGNSVPVSRNVLTDSNGYFEAGFERIRSAYNTKYVYFSNYSTYFVQPSMLTIKCGDDTEYRKLLVTTFLFHIEDTTPDGVVDVTRVICKTFYHYRYYDGYMIKWLWERLPLQAFPERPN